MIRWDSPEGDTNLRPSATVRTFTLTATNCGPTHSHLLPNYHGTLQHVGAINPCASHVPTFQSASEHVGVPTSVGVRARFSPDVNHPKHSLMPMHSTSNQSVFSQPAPGDSSHEYKSSSSLHHYALTTPTPSECQHHLPADASRMNAAKRVE